MALTSGDSTAASGMAKNIYDKLREVFEPGIGTGAEADQIRSGWKKLAYAVAAGVIQHVVSNMAINGITTDTNHTQNNDGTGHVS